MNGYVLNLFFKPERGASMVEQTALQLKVGLGILNDLNANSISPRQVLIVNNQDLRDMSIQPGVLRENIVISGNNLAAFNPGSMLQFSGGASIRLTFYCEPCKQVANLGKSLKDLEGKRGILGVVVTDGSLTVGDHFNIHPNAFPPLPEHPYDRFLYFLNQIPAGQVVTYKEIVIGIGVTTGYFRAIPKYLQRADIAGYPVHRVLDSEGRVTPHVIGQDKRLEAEGVLVSHETRTVLLEKYLWKNPSVYD